VLSGARQTELRRPCWPALTLLAVLLAWGAVPAIAGGDPDGSYRGELTDEDGVDYGEVRFKVAKDGRRIKNFEALPLAVCVNPDVSEGSKSSRSRLCSQRSR